MKTIYICERCGKQFSNYDECANCERAHITPIASPYSGIEASGYVNAAGYPQCVIIEMTDGAKVGYCYDGIIAEPEETEQESIQEASDNA